MIIWGDEAASPRALAGRLNEIRIRLGLADSPACAAGLVRGGRLMPHILSLLNMLAQQPCDAHWIRSEIHRVLTTIRGQEELAAQVIPACPEQLAHEQIDDLITGVWLMSARIDVDYDSLLELDALGAALDLCGCVTRVGLPRAGRRSSRPRSLGERERPDAPVGGLPSRTGARAGAATMAVTARSAIGRRHVTPPSDSPRMTVREELNLRAVPPQRRQRFQGKFKHVGCNCAQR